jgi:hypothetical protein
MSGETALRGCPRSRPRTTGRWTGDEALLGHLGGVEVGALLLHRAHRVADDEGRVPGGAIKTLGQKKMPRDLHAKLVREGGGLHGDQVALVEIVGVGGHGLGPYGVCR